MTDRFDDAVGALWPTVASHTSFEVFHKTAADLRGALVADLSSVTCPYACWSASTEIGSVTATFTLERIVRIKRWAFCLVGAADMPLIARWTEEPLS